LGNVLTGTADPHRLLTLLDFDLRNAGFFQQFDEFFDFTNIHGEPAFLEVTAPSG
jgi:hypothetical protein